MLTIDEFKALINYDALPDEAVWLSIDGNGELRWSDSKPELSKVYPGWRFYGASVGHLFTVDLDGDWRQARWLRRKMKAAQ